MNDIYMESKLIPADMFARSVALSPALCLRIIVFCLKMAL
jgi:hypothetical protein